MNSIRKQTYRQIEVIIIDDNSSDKSIDKIRNYTDLNIQLLKNAFNRGPGFCRNLGLKAASGEYVAFLDSDDYWFPNHLELLVDYFEQHNNRFFLYSKVLVLKDEELFKRFQLKIVTKKSLLLTTSICTSSVLIKREVLLNLEFKEVFYDDLLFWYECLGVCGKAYLVDNYGACYRISKKSYSSDKVKSASEVFSMYKKNFNLGFAQRMVYFSSYVLIGIIKVLQQTFCSYKGSGVFDKTNV